LLAAPRGFVAAAEAAARHCAAFKEASAASSLTAGGGWESGASLDTWVAIVGSPPSAAVTPSA